MTEEEKKAIECLKIVVDDINECGAEYYIDKDILSDIQTALNLIKKLQKENEELNLSNIYKTTKAIKDFIEIDLGTGKYQIYIQDLDEELIRLRKENEEMRRHNKVRIIDIFTKIANGEKVPKKIKYNCLEKGYEVLIYDEEEQEYRFENDMDNFLTVSNHHLKDRIEILED